MRLGPGEWRAATAGWLENGALEDSFLVTLDVGSTRGFVSAVLDVGGRIEARMHQKPAAPGATSRIVVTPETGSIRLAAGQTDVTVRPGDVVLIDSDRECWLSADDARIRLVCLPTAGLPYRPPVRAEGEAALHRLDGSHQPNAVLAGMVADVCNRHWSTQAGRRDMMAMLGYCLAPVDRHPAPAMISGHAMPAYSSFVDTYLLENVADRSLGAGAIAEHLGVSPASVYRRFARHGGVAAYIRAFRLDRSFEHLLQRGERRVSLDVVAERFGFSNRSVFSKAFKRRFGFSPVALTKQKPDAGEIARKAARMSAPVVHGGGTDANAVNFDSWMTRNAFDAMLAELATGDRPG